MRKYLLMALFIACLSLSCKKEQTVSNFENPQQGEANPEFKQSESNLSRLLKLDKSRTYEIKRREKSIAVFSEILGENKGAFYVFEDKTNGRSFLIKSLRPIDFTKDLVNRNFVSKLSLEDFSGQKYRCKLSSKKQDQSYARAGVGEPGQLCIDWYWIIYDEKTGEIISEIYVTTTCSDGSGGNGGSGGTIACNYSVEEGESLLQDFKPYPLYLAENGTSTNEETFGPYTKVAKTPTWTFLRLALPLGYSVEYTAKFQAVAYRESNSTDIRDWKWESFTYHTTTLTDGSVTHCFDLEMTPTISCVIDQANPRRATGSISWTAKLTLVCSGGIPRFAPRNGALSDQEWFAHNN